MASTGPPGSAQAGQAPGQAATAAHPSAGFARPAPARAKRVPDNQRRRAAVSCDHCKQRRAKCMRASPREPCSNCIANKIKCQSTLPRKQRVYGSVESLSLRYRALEALVKGLLQDEEDDAAADTAAGTTTDDDAMLDSPAQHTPALDIDALYRAAAARGIPMPPREDMTPANEIFATTAGGQPGAAPPTIVPTPLTSPSETVTPTSFPQGSNASGNSNSLPPTPMHPPQYQHLQQHQLPATTLTTPSADEKLIPTPHGVAHYVGPSSSFRFVTSIRALVAQCGDSIGNNISSGTGASENGSIASPAGIESGPSATGDAASSSSQAGGSATRASDATAAQTSASIRDDFVGLKTSKALEVQESSGGDEDEEGDDEDDSEDGDDESDGDDYDEDAMDDVVREERAHLQQTQPSPHKQQSPDVPFHPQHQQTLPTRNFTPQSSGPAGGSGANAGTGNSGSGGGALSAPSPANSRRSRSEFDDAANAATFLPARETANIFVRVFFDRVHPNYPLFHRNTFLLRYEALWQQPPNEQTPVPQPATPSPQTNPGNNNQPPSQQDDYGWNCCLAMVFAFGAQVFEDHERARRASAGMQRRYLNLVRSSLSRLAGTTNLANVQALLLLQLYEHNAGQRNAAWNFLGCASRMAVALGMHRDGVAIPVTPMGPPETKGSSNSSQRRGGGGSLVARAAAAASLPASASSPEQVNDRNARRRVWWTLYSFERSLCIMLGRPSALDEAEIAVAAPNDDSQSADLPQGHSASLLKLIRITWRIKQMVFPAPGSAHNIGFSSNQAYGAYYPISTDPTAIPRQLLSELETWRNSLPAHLQPGWKSTDLSHRRAVLILHVQYQYARSLATRQYVLDRAERCRVQAQAQSSSSTVQNTKQAPGTVIPAPAPGDDLAEICVTAAERALDFCHQLADIGQLDGVAWIDVYFIYHSVLIICLDLLTRTVAASAKEKTKDGKDGKDASETKADVIAARRRTAVRSILQITQRTRLAGTFRVLILVACQLAAIVGALDGLPTLPAATSSSSSGNHGGASSGKHRASHGSSARSGSLTTTRGRGRRRRNSSSVSRDRTTSRGPYSSSGQRGKAGSASNLPNTSMAPPPTTTGNNTSAVSDTSSPANMFYSPQTQYEQQHHHQHQQQQQFQQQQQHSLQQIQQLPAFGGADWFAPDPSSFPWHTFDATSLGLATGQTTGAGGLPPNTNIAPPIGSANTAAAAAAAAAANFPVAFIQPQGIDFGMTSDTSTFSEDPYMVESLHHHHNHSQQHPQQQQIYQMNRGGPATSGSGAVPPTAAFATGGGNMDLESGHHHHAQLQQQQQQQQQHPQQQYLQHPPQLDNHEWQQVFREYTTKHQ
ncbi:hypothetical protein SEUCBS139899_009362 [Sporothrix eucalyptigena]|uniref:Zn(2)-C6 fungal-type domain-containing protein n=1 Tax=Sporothrix eucalyptigena TaxID=1812306 RepID=A0ABP0CWR0_9PEZI